jgi:dolichyl-phosphate beta-glucosyltransferase
MAAYRAFIETHPQVMVCFVNDGSTDNTMEVLGAIKKDFPQQVEVIENAQNMGIGETVSNGINHAFSFQNIEEAGFLDADLSTGFDEYLEMLELMKKDKNMLMIFGSRKDEDGKKINYNPFRLFAAIISRFIVRRILKQPITDTQCGAKIFSREAAAVAFNTSFETRWLFDVEVIIRLQQYFGMANATPRIYEFFVARWKHEPDSRLVLKDMVIMPYQFLKIMLHYKINPLF